MNIKIVLVYLIVVCFFSAAPAFSSEEAEEYPIMGLYNNLNDIYDKSISSEKYQEAYYAAEEILSIDPSDSLAYLKLIYAAKKLCLDLQEVKDKFGGQVSESSAQNKKIKELANSLVESYESKTCKK